MTQSSDAPSVSSLTPQQAWLKQLVGEWDVEYTMYIQPDQPPSKASGVERVRAIGDHWIVAETITSMAGAPFSSVQSIGYDRRSKVFRASWIDCMSGHLWVYTGTLDESLNALTLETSGPSVPDPGITDPSVTARYREVLTMTGADSHTYSARMELPTGEWRLMLDAAYRRRR